MKYRYTVDGFTGVIEAENEAEADLMVRELVEIEIEEVDDEKI